MAIAIARGARMTDFIRRPSDRQRVFALALGYEDLGGCAGRQSEANRGEKAEARGREVSQARFVDIFLDGHKRAPARPRRHRRTASKKVGSCYYDSY